MNTSRVPFIKSDDTPANGTYETQQDQNDSHYIEVTDDPTETDDIPPPEMYRGFPPDTDEVCKETDAAEGPSPQADTKQHAPNRGRGRGARGSVTAAALRAP